MKSALFLDLGGTLIETKNDGIYVSKSENTCN